MYLKSADEMAQPFRRSPEAIKNTLDHRREVQRLKLKLGKPMLPSFDVPEGFDDADATSAHVAREGLERRFAEFAELGKRSTRTAYRTAPRDARSTSSCKMKFPGYFLIVWDFIRYAKRERRPRRPGPRLRRRLARRVLDADHRSRSHSVQPALRALPQSGARVACRTSTSTSAWTGATRSSTTCRRSTARRRVGQIATFARAQGEERHQGRGARAWASRRSRRSRSRTSSRNKTPGRDVHDPREPRRRAEAQGALRHRAAHQGAPHAGASSSRASRGTPASTPPASSSAKGPLWDHVPCFKDGKSEIVTQYYKDDVEQAGLVKFDFLGLKTLTVLDIADAPHQRAPRSSRRREAVRHRDASRSTTSRRTSSCRRGETKGVFQLESSGMQQLFKDLQPDAFEDIVARRRALSPRPARHRHGEGLRRLQARSQADREDAPLVDDIARADLRRHRLPRAGHADRADARRLLARRRRPSPPRDGQEEARGDGEAEDHLRRRRARATASPKQTPTASSACSSSSPATASTRVTLGGVRASSRTRRPI